jgi:hypothetical protein
MESEDKNYWKQISDSNYEASVDGEIRNIKTGRVLKQRINRYGYMLVDIQINKKNKTVKTHRLIAETFLSKDLEKTEVDHINRVKTDNRVENLRWVTRSENMKNIDWSNAKRTLVSKKNVIKISELLNEGKTIEEVYNIINNF